MMNLIIILTLLMILLVIPHKDVIKNNINKIVQTKENINSGLMNKMTTGINRHPFEVSDDLPYLNNYNSKPFRYRRIEIEPMPEGMIIDDRDKNLKLLQDERCFGN